MKLIYNLVRSRSHHPFFAFCVYNFFCCDQSYPLHIECEKDGSLLSKLFSSSSSFSSLCCLFHLLLRSQLILSPPYARDGSRSAIHCSLLSSWCADIIRVWKLDVWIELKLSHCGECTMTTVLTCRPCIILMNHIVLHRSTQHTWHTHG